MPTPVQLLFAKRFEVSDKIGLLLLARIGAFSALIGFQPTVSSAKKRLGFDKCVPEFLIDR
jgi:hypothetical protein